MSGGGFEVRRWNGAAPAKVNLFLRIFDRESSGYHRIETLFQALELSDRVSIEALGSGSHDHDGEPPVELRLEGVGEGELGPTERNLAFRAASRFLVELRSFGLTPPRLWIVLEKRFPHGAGLGGGSSNAATVLLGANDLTGDPLSREELLRIGGELGSDVPFFLTGVARAIGAGRGEILTPLPPLPQREVLLLVPEDRIATAWAYGVLSEVRKRSGWRSISAPVTTSPITPSPVPAEPVPAEPVPAEPVPGEPDLARPEGGVGSDWESVAVRALNDFEPVLFPLRPELERWKDLLLRNGASLALLSGSGSVIFGVFTNRRELESAALEAEESEVRALRTRTRA
jgi:4-diphosphocytidyl-2-C-methyl-D-erythritol kinase